ncbi:hypothetical protein C8Q79DRAFT_930521 [Trametes meyenii]|nr:hypothetical protein C8Q79DRAFT_930521 [Trametes meyenii]
MSLVGARERKRPNDDEHGVQLSQLAAQSHYCPSGADPGRRCGFSLARSQASLAAHGTRLASCVALSMVTFHNTESGDLEISPTIAAEAGHARLMGPNKYTSESVILRHRAEAKGCNTQRGGGAEDAESVVIAQNGPTRPAGGNGWKTTGDGKKILESEAQR